MPRPDGGTAQHIPKVVPEFLKQPVYTSFFDSSNDCRDVVDRAGFLSAIPSHGISH